METRTLTVFTKRRSARSSVSPDVQFAAIGTTDNTIDLYTLLRGGGGGVISLFSDNRPSWFSFLPGPSINARAFARVNKFGMVVNKQRYTRWYVIAVSHEVVFRNDSANAACSETTPE